MMPVRIGVVSCLSRVSECRVRQLVSQNAAVRDRPGETDRMIQAWLYKRSEACVSTQPTLRSMSAQVLDYVRQFADSDTYVETASSNVCE